MLNIISKIYPIQQKPKIQKPIRSKQRENLTHLNYQIFKINKEIRKTHNNLMQLNCLHQWKSIINNTNKNEDPSNINKATSLKLHLTNNKTRINLP